MLKEIFKKAIYRTLIPTSGFAFSELFGGVFLALLISSFAEKNLLEEYGLTNEFLVLGFVLFCLKSFVSYASLKRLLQTSHNISKEVVLSHLNKVLAIKSTEMIDTDKLIKNVSHEVLSLQANGTTPILFIVSDSLAIFFMFITAAYFSPLIVGIFLCFIAVIGLISYSVTRKLTVIARLRSESEQKKIEYTRSLSTSRLVYQNLNIKKVLFDSIVDFTSVSADNGTKHQSITQLPRIYLELLIVIIFSATIFIELDLNQNYIISSIIIVRTFPNLIRIIYNQANIKAASVSAKLLEDGLLKGYVKEDILTEVICKIDNQKKMHIYSNDERYKNEIEVPTGLSVIVGPSGSGKSVLFKNALRYLNIHHIKAEYFSREMINDDLVVEHLASNFLNLSRSDRIPQEIYEIARRINSGEKNSTGEGERLILAYASHIDTDVIVLDEFFINIEDKQKKIYMDMIIKERKDKITILISHDQFAQNNPSIQRIEVINEDFQK